MDEHEWEAMKKYIEAQRLGQCGIWVRNYR